ncbi:monovalent cation/H+ antiporter subunit D family protein [Corynebacterium hindlerae]|uniref:Monovalent cation/H+ antiporter subunit D family protein n=1 Tax=Corynebacterium hindlerae TaxID=699041 RepID=A0A7G5FI66_9CORY|nr:monovalent cation/H+ antiporter subunit D family protein [Corynebacterium hindlerae]QMV86307.1 monovalent cation/H+ antiporter subunit D family protein [Corynebacterium hindlerae]
MILPLFVAVPLTAAALAVIAPWRWLRSLLFVVVPFLGIPAGVWLFTQGTIGHNVGLYPGGVSIAFAADQFTALFVITTSVVALTANWFAFVSGEITARFYPALTLMLIAGVNGALLTADLFNLFVFIEVMLLPSYGLMAMTGTRSRLAAGRTFVLSNLFASTLLLIGAGLVYAVSGTVNYAALAGAADHGPLVVAMGVVVIALAVKAGVVPLHTWLPRTYPATSSAVMGLFSGLHTKVAVFVLYRLYVVVFDADERWSWFIIAVMCVSMLIGGFAGLGERTIRRVLAYQMVNGMPFILVMLAFGTEAALAAGILYALHHMITVGSLVLTTGAIEETYGTGTLSKLYGLARRDPIASTVWAAGAFSVVGFPPFSGMWGKVGIVFAAAEPGNMRSWLVISVVIVASIGALLSMLRVWRKVFWGKPMGRYSASLGVTWAKLLPGLSLMVVSVGMFFAAGPLIDAISTASHALFDVPSYVSAVFGTTDPIGVVNASV